MTDRRFLDTNVLVYAFDSHAPLKQRRAQDLLAEALETETGVISTQVLSEFYVVVTSRVKPALSSRDAEEIIRQFAGFHTLDIDRALVMRAIETQRHYAISYWDALILAAAERGRCSVLLSEDLNHGQTYHGIRVVNPFLASPTDHS